MRGAQLEHLGGAGRADVVVDEASLLGRHERHAGDGAGDGVEAQLLPRVLLGALLSSASTAASLVVGVTPQALLERLDRALGVAGCRAAPWRARRARSRTG